MTMYVQMHAYFGFVSFFIFCVCDDTVYVFVENEKRQRAVFISVLKLHSLHQHFSFYSLLYNNIVQHKQI